MSSQCERCKSPNNEEYFPPGGRETFAPYDIVAAIESAHTPVEQGVFNETERPEGTTVPLFPKRTMGNSEFHGRPAIALESGTMKHPNGQLVRTVLLLIATYWGQYHRRQDLPLVLQHFSIGVYQHNTVGSEPNKFHIHTRPDWANSRDSKDSFDAWLIAREYTFEGRLGGMWLNVNRADTKSCSSFTIEEDYRQELDTAVNDCWKDWTAHCQFDPKHLENCVADYAVRPLTYSPGHSST